MTKIKKVLILQILILANMFFASDSLYSESAVSTKDTFLRVPLFSQQKRFSALPAILLEVEGPVREAISRFEAQIQGLTETDLASRVNKGNGTLKIASHGSRLEIAIGTDITTYASFIPYSNNGSKEAFQLYALINPYDKSQKVLIALTENHVALRVNAGDWSVFKRKAYLYISIDEFSKPFLADFKDHLWKAYFDDSVRREDYILSQGRYQDRELVSTSEVYSVGCGLVTLAAPKKKGTIWANEALPRIRRIARAKKAAGVWPSALVEIIPSPGQDVEQGISFWKTQAGRPNYILFLPLSAKALIYTRDGLAETMEYTGKQFTMSMAYNITVNTFIDSVYKHKGIKWREQKLGSQRDADGKKPHGHFDIGQDGIFQTHMLQDLTVLYPDYHSEGWSWYPSRVLKDEEGVILELSHLGENEFGMFMEGKDVTQKGRQAFIILKGRYFYLPFIADLLMREGLVTNDFLERISSIPLNQLTSLAEYEIRGQSERIIYNSSSEQWVKASVIEIEALGEFSANPSLIRKFIRSERSVPTSL